MFKCDKLKATNVSVGVCHKIKTYKNYKRPRRNLQNQRKSDLKVALFLKIQS